MNQAWAQWSRGTRFPGGSGVIRYLDLRTHYRLSLTFPREVTRRLLQRPDGQGLYVADPMSSDAGSPDTGEDASLRLIQGDSLSSSTAQTGGMLRSAAISGDLVGASALWMGRTVVLPGTSSGDHHHGHAETGIYVVSGHPVFVFRDPDSGSLVRLETAPGDYVWVPPNAPHREENPSPDTEAVVVIARSTQEAIVVNVPSL